MTAHFALAATTFVLRGVIERRLAAAYGKFPTPRVSVEPPPRPPAAPGATPGGSAPEPAALFLFLHHVGPNPAGRNRFDPHLDSTGRRVGPSPVVMDLHYLLAATGADLEREVLLGLGVTALTRPGIVPRPLIESILTAVAPPPEGDRTRLLDTLTKEPLHDPKEQPEQITISQSPVDVDLSTKIWSALQSPMRPCAHFLVTTVFLDFGDPSATAEDTGTVEIAVAPREGT